MPSRGVGLERLGFPPRRRLRRKSDFERVYARGRRWGDGFFAIIVSANRTGEARLGLAVAVKTVGSSVERNRIRRVIRETFRLRQHELPGVDLVVSARPQARGARNEQLRASLNTLWDRVIQQCASLPRS
ncbi:MAG TPA: ribonuclease P protein component [Steroidobacteraceae bacterium]|nr:ribonuclease P protein component [Steroidobacteraceae bacterium]